MALKEYRLREATPPVARQAEGLLRSLARAFPVLVVTGPRQSGKTTLVRATFPGLPYVNLEDPDTREWASTDPRRFLAHHADGAVLDEVQRVPSLWSYLLGMADQATREHRMGRFVLTGSQQLDLMGAVSQSLAGRAGLVQLLPLSHAELQAHASGQPTALEHSLFEGGYPALHGPHRPERLVHWFSAYMSTYLERDVRQLLNIGNLLSFQRFVAMCAARSAQLLNLNSLASDCGISQPTARQWLTVLQASGLVTLLPPYHRNFGKRLVKTPKLYFLDTGLLCHLLRVADADELRTHAARGAIFETWVLSETLKHRFNRGLPADLYFWRDNHGLEVDLVFQHRARLHAVECKSGQTLASDALAPVRRWAGLVGAEAAKPVLLHGGDRSHEAADHLVMSWRDLGWDWV